MLQVTLGHSTSATTLERLSRRSAHSFHCKQASINHRDMRTTGFSKLALAGALAVFAFNSSSSTLAFEELSEVKASSFSWGSQIGNLKRMCDQKHLGGLEVSESRTDSFIHSINKRYRTEISRTRQRMAGLGVAGVADLALFRSLVVGNNDIIEDPACKKHIGSLSWPTLSLPEDAENYYSALLNDWFFNGFVAAQLKTFCRAEHQRIISTERAKYVMSKLIAVAHRQKNSKHSDDAFTHLMLHGVFQLGESGAGGDTRCTIWILDKIDELEKKV